MSRTKLIHAFFILIMALPIETKAWELNCNPAKDKVLAAQAELAQTNQNVISASADEKQFLPQIPIFKRLVNDLQFALNGNAKAQVEQVIAILKAMIANNETITALIEQLKADQQSLLTTPLSAQIQNFAQHENLSDDQRLSLGQLSNAVAALEKDSQASKDDAIKMLDGYLHGASASAPGLLQIMINSDEQIDANAKQLSQEMSEAQTQLNQLQKQVDSDQTIVDAGEKRISDLNVQIPQLQSQYISCLTAATNISINQQIHRPR